MIRKVLSCISPSKCVSLGLDPSLVNSRRFNRLSDSILIGCGFAILLVAPSYAIADAWIVQPSVRLEGIYDDNFRLDPDVPDDVAVARISPAVKVSRITETTDIAGLLRVDGNFYFGDDETQGRQLDNQSNQLLDLSYFRVGELSRLGGVLSFRRDTLLRTIGASEDTDDVTEDPDSTDDVDEGLTRANVERRRLVLGPSWNRLLTERTEVGLSYQFTDVSLSDVDLSADETGSGGVSDYQTHGVGAELLTRVTEIDRLALVFEGRRYDTDEDDRQLNNYDLQAGVVHEFSETTTGLFTVGARYTEFDFLGEEFDGSDTGFAATLSGTKRTGLTTFNGTIERTATPSVSGNLVETDQIIFNLSRLLSERASFLLRSRIFETEAIGQGQVATASLANRRFISIEPRLRYELSPSWALETAYEYRREKEFDETGSADSNAVFLSLIYERPVEVDPARPVYDLEDRF